MRNKFQYCCYATLMSWNWKKELFWFLPENGWFEKFILVHFEVFLLFKKSKVRLQNLLCKLEAILLMMPSWCLFSVPLTYISRWNSYLGCISGVLIKKNSFIVTDFKHRRFSIWPVCMFFVRVYLVIDFDAIFSKKNFSDLKEGFR